MGKILAILALCSLPVFAQEIKEGKDGTVVITISKEQSENCKKEGGCVLISMKAIEGIVWEASSLMCGKKI